VVQAHSQFPTTFGTALESHSFYDSQFVVSMLLIPNITLSLPGTPLEVTDLPSLELEFQYSGGTSTRLVSLRRIPMQAFFRGLLPIAIVNNDAFSLNPGESTLGERQRDLIITWSRPSIWSSLGTILRSLCAKVELELEPRCLHVPATSAHLGNVARKQLECGRTYLIA